MKYENIFPFQQNMQSATDFFAQFLTCGLKIAQLLEFLISNKY